MDADGTVLEKSWYRNTFDGIREFAARVKAEYGPCKAVCEATGSHWTKTADVFEGAGSNRIKDPEKERPYPIGQTETLRSVTCPAPSWIGRKG